MVGPTADVGSPMVCGVATGIGAATGAAVGIEGGATAAAVGVGCSEDDRYLLGTHWIALAVSSRPSGPPPMQQIL